jgi:steroid 5-alpha reductase family enzyme
VDKYLRGNTLAVLPSMRSFAPRQLIASGLVLLWAARLGSFLYQRIQKSGKDERFDEIKQSPPKFFGAWCVACACVRQSSAAAHSAR